MFLSKLEEFFAQKSLGKPSRITAFWSSDNPDSWGSNRRKNPEPQGLGNKSTERVEETLVKINHFLLRRNLAYPRRRLVLTLGIIEILPHLRTLREVVAN